MADYTIDLSDVANAATQLDSVAQRLEQALQDLQAKVAQFQAVNEGQAIENYGEAQQRWNSGLTQVRTGTQKATGVLREIGDNYEAGDRQGAALFVA